MSRNQDVFPILDLQELVICLQSCDFALATQENISRPTSDYMVTLYKQIIENFMGISVESLLNSSNQETGDGHLQEENENIYSDTLNVLVLNKICFKFFENIGVQDFNMTDLYKPEAQRTQRLLSAVVNYARFREERMFDCNSFILQMESLLGQLRSKFDDYNLIQQQLKQYEDVDGDNIPDEQELQKLEEQNKELEIQLKKLTKIQETLSIDYNDYKISKQSIFKDLEALSFQIVELESNRDKLIKISNTDMEELSEGIKELNGLLIQRKKTLDDLTAQQKNLQDTVTTFETIISELYDVLRIISSEVQESNRTETELVGLKQNLINNKLKLMNVLETGIMYKLEILQEQLDLQLKNLEKLSQDTKEESRLNDTKLMDLQIKYENEIKPKIDKTDIFIQEELISGKINKLNDEIKQLQKDFEAEVKEIEIEYSLLSGHINKYMNEMLEYMQ
ncbi:ANL_collapsed_G0049080.mRNA.1.CDS.1 [Saccharomyces cerevisiae]|nr:ANL_HP_G0046780.mRNA.1.CDS.1 [Saccharomyces cerevisiae]CAI5001581.1 ANM_HP_G0163620.mRNA.1.CDS.1 [Saccharomyces cerevisiae]CAI5005501.1 AVN_HP_G0048000.mRNA.1.CDS.1 [Saccharomyces cerevisiae]CAI5018001.1 ANM_HP_G0178340.mRNA.1.CDS.1 [Saccharomyces cerevisiae]CAI5024433.1 ANM_HP_G0184280.mRNA.1.CDS.1 [Saccharomyces cerevisiae]